MNKEEALISYLLTCPQLKNNKSFFNFSESKEYNKMFSVIPNDVATSKEYIDGSIDKLFTLTIIDFRPVLFQPLVKNNIDKNQNIEEYLDVQEIINWIDEQNDARNFPDFGDDCVIDKIYTTSNVPNMNGVDTSTLLAKYSISIKIEYLDESKKIK